MKPHLDSLATALYVRSDDLLKESPQLAPRPPSVGHHAEAQRRGAGHAGGAAGPAGLHLRAAVDPSYPRSPTTSVPVPTDGTWLQQQHGETDQT